MPRLLSRLTRAVLCLSIVSCAPAGGAYPASSAEQGSGRYRVLIPDPQALGGVASRDAERVGARLRSAFTQMLRHTAVDQRAARGAMRQYGIESLDPTTARQLAQQIGAANVLFVEMSPGGSGLQADAQFIDVASGDVLRYDDLTGADADQLSAGILARVEQSIEGILQAGSCNDYLSSSQPERALTACEAALAIVPTSSAALYGKATALLHLERHDEALQSYRELLERESANQEALLGAGLAASHLGRSDEALQFYNRYLELDPENLEVRKTVAHQVATAGDYVAAYHVLEPAFDDSASVGNAEFQRYLFSLAAAAGQRAASGNEAEGREFYQTAMQAYQRAFSADSARPDATQIRQAIGVMNALGRVEDALSLAREATVRFDTVAAIWSQYASVLANAERQSEAAQALTRVIELDPDAENAYLRRGMAYLAAGQRQQGLDDLRRAAERGNGEQAAVVMFQQGVRAGEAGRWAEAGDLLESATRYAAASVRPQVVFYHGYVLYKQGEAIAKANTSASAAPAREALSLFQRALPLLQQGESPQKQQMLQVIQQYIANQEAIIQAAAR